MAGKYYAVRKGKKPGIYQTWDDCKLQVHEFTGAEYKSFKTREEAEAFLKMGSYRRKKEALKKDTDSTELLSKEEKPILIENIPDGVMIAYVDGSYHKITEEFSFGMVVLTSEGEFTDNGKFNDQELAAMHNVAGEIEGAKAAMAYALEHHYKKVIIYHDYEGIAKWCLGLWKTNKEGTKSYKAYYDEIKNKVEIRFVKVKGHSNDKYNDLADTLAKEALGI